MQRRYVSDQTRPTIKMAQTSTMIQAKHTLFSGYIYVVTFVAMRYTVNNTIVIPINLVRWTKNIARLKHVPWLNYWARILANANRRLEIIFFFTVYLLKFQYSCSVMSFR